MQRRVCSSVARMKRSENPGPADQLKRFPRIALRSIRATPLLERRQREDRDIGEQRAGIGRRAQRCLISNIQKGMRNAERKVEQGQQV